MEGSSMSTIILDILNIWNQGLTLCPHIREAWMKISILTRKIRPQVIAIESSIRTTCNLRTRCSIMNAKKVFWVPITDPSCSLW